MRSSVLVIAAAVTALSGTAAAQTAPSTASAAPTAPAPPPPPATYFGPTPSHWIASGFVGTNFDTSGDSTVIDGNEHHFSFGGQVGYLWRGIVGGEFMADFAPSVSDDVGITEDGNLMVNTYMANAIGAYPLGAEGRFQPYASGGVGRVSVVADVLNVIGDLAFGTDQFADGRFGYNFGAGLMAYANRVGVRGDIRWYRATTNNNVDTTEPLTDQLAQSLLSGLQFWRANVGVAFRW
jgi:hypothetical protein